jgi:membrane-bound lytic murein transglycosylase B
MFKYQLTIAKAARVTIITAICCILGCASDASPAQPKAAQPQTCKTLSVKGWGHLAEKLQKDGIGDAEIEAAFQDRRMPAFDHVSFKLHPAEHPSIYRRYFSQTSVTHVRQFIRSHQDILGKAYARYGVGPGVIASILYIETAYGYNTGSDIVFNRLCRIANIADKENLEWNLQKLKGEDSKTTRFDVEERAKYLEKTFYPEVLALFEMRRRFKLDMLSLRGSVSGAFGIPQFLPSTYLKFGIDGNNNGVISLYELDDAVLSVAYFLNSFGWSESIQHPAKREIIWHYNKSAPYIEAVLFLAETAGSTQKIR